MDKRIRRQRTVPCLLVSVMKRKIYQELLKWKESSHGRTAMLIDGARRVGKSYIAVLF
jgi:predicted AAA+ superfamily ATPase